MKKWLTIRCICVACPLFLWSQSKQSKVEVYQTTDHYRIASLKDFAKDHVTATKENKQPRNSESNRNATLFQSFDPFGGVNVLGINRVDPSISVGQDHIVVLKTGMMRVFDKEANPLSGIIYTDSLFPPEFAYGYSQILYDEMANRWVIRRQCESPSGICRMIVLSETHDPLGAWNFWSLPTIQGQIGTMRLGIWHSGYLLSGTQLIENNVEAYIFNRNAMLNGDSVITVIGVHLTEVLESLIKHHAVPVIQSGYFESSGPAMFLEINEDAWGYHENDFIRMWEVEPDWETPQNTIVEIAQIIPISPFTAIFKELSSCTDLPYHDSPPNNAVNAWEDSFMFPIFWRDFETHQSIVCCHTVEADTMHSAGIKWYELRSTGGEWNIYQEGLYFIDDGTDRFLGSFGMDHYGNLAMGYSVISENLDPSLRFTGRGFNDPLHEMACGEQFIADADQFVFNDGCDFGRYSQIALDPEDGRTFWFASMAGDESWIASWQIDNVPDKDVGALDLLSPVTGALSATESIEINVKNYGGEDQTGFDVHYQVNNGPIITESFTNIVNAGSEQSYLFSTTTDMNDFGNYQIKLWTSLVDDFLAINDTVSVYVSHLLPYDASPINLIAPVSDQLLTNDESVTVTINNVGYEPINNVPIHLNFNNSILLNENVAQTIQGQSSYEYTFSQTVNMSAVGSYSFEIYTDLDLDGDQSNDTLQTTVENYEPMHCIGTADCDKFGDAITRVRVSNLDNTSDCGENGYQDFTDLTAILDIDQAYEFGVTCEFFNHWVSMWIDFNWDYEFSEDERIIDGLEIEEENEEFTINLIFPEGTPEGEFVMRVRTILESSSTPILVDPCEDINLGETEDYMVSISDINGIKELSDPFGAVVYFNEQGKLILKILASAPIIDHFHLFDLQGRSVFKSRIQNENNVHEFAIPQLSSGAYIFTIENQSQMMSYKIVKF